jgi:gliding motility-associated-like protein
MSVFPKLLLAFLLLISADIFAQCPPNIGFEDGKFTNWECWAGDVNKLGVVNVSLTAPINNRHTLISASDYVKTDPYGNFPTLCPNGSKYSIRLGNSDTGRQAERVTYTYTVPAGQASTLILNYAVVLQNPAGHDFYEQPRFTAKIYDVTDDKPIDCPSFDFIAASGLPGFKLSTVSTGGRGGPTSIYYKEWSSTTINLVGYGGKEVRLEFTTNDCTRGGHFGYAYLDLDEGCTTAISGNTYCAGQDSITLHAPSGFDGYLWFKGTDLTQLPIGNTETLTLASPPDQSKYTLEIVPYPGLGCPDTLYTTINKIFNAFKLVVPDTLYACRGSSVDLTAPAVTVGSTSGLTLSYLKDRVTLDYIYTPNAITTSGTYYIRGISPEGCMNILPVYVKIVDPPNIVITDPQGIQYPNTADLSKTYTRQTGLTYSYYTDAAGTIPIADFTNIGVTGTYFIKVTNSLGCTNILPVNVVINPPPAYIISGPNVFTPNNDGTNDHFMIKIDGFVTFVGLKIYNRYGQLLFQTKSQDAYWDGTYNGRQLPVGTYYWVFEGADQYYHTKVTKAASITIVR